MSAADNTFGTPRPALLRPELIIVESDESERESSFLVRDPKSGEAYGFGEEEWFLLTHAGDQSRFESLAAEFEGRFGSTLSRDDLDGFLAMVGNWGLLVRPSEKPMPAPQAPAGPAPGPAALPGADAELAEDDPGAWQTLAEEGGPIGRRPLATGGAAMLLDERDVQWTWFNPSRLLARTARGLGPLRFLVWLLPVLLALALAAVFYNLDRFVGDFVAALNETTLIQHLLFSMVTVNLVSQVVRGMVCEYHGGTAGSFGIRFVFHLIPRFAIDISGLEALSRRSQMWIHGSPLLARLFLFGIGVILWQSARAGGTHLGEIGAMLAVISLITFFLAANPLLRGNGYRLLAAALDMPYLRQRANRALFGRRKGGGPGGADSESRFALAAFALASLIFIILLLGLVLVFLARWLELHYQGTGVAIFLVLLVYLVLLFRKRILEKRERIRSVREQAAGAGGVSGEHSIAGLAGSRRSGASPEPSNRQARRPPKPRRGWLGWLVLAALIPVLFLPYPYETGGPLEVIPEQRHEIYPDQVRGVIQSVYYKGGERLTKGTVLAVVSSLEEETDILTTQAALLEQQAKLEELLATPRPEELALARQRLETARTEAAFSAESAQRQEKLYKTGTVSLEDYDDERRKAEVDRMRVLEEEAHLAQVESGPHPQEVEAAQHHISRLKSELKFNEERLRLTRLTMPFDGRVVTRNLDHLAGKFLDSDELFAVVENDSTLRVEIQIPEADVGQVEAGRRVRLKAWAYPDRIFYGEVAEISPVAEEATFGRVVVVTAIIENPEGLLRSGMTGFGKVDGGTKPVIVAFTRMLVRFFLVEVWSWLP